MRWFPLCLKVALVYCVVGAVEGYKIRFGRERSRILKLRKRKSAFVDRLNLITRTRGIGIFTLRATADDSAAIANPGEESQAAESFEEFLPKKKKKRQPKNPIVEKDLERYEPIFRKIPALRQVQKEVERDQRPGALNPLGYAAHFVPEGDWSFHPNLIRVRGKYFSKLYEKELSEPFKMHDRDSGSSQVQIAALTAKLDYLARHVRNNHKDVQARLQVIKLGHRRRRLLGYLYRTNRSAFDTLIKTFNIDFDDSPYCYKKLVPSYSHMHHRKTKRYTSAKEQRTATRQRVVSTMNTEMF